MDGMLDRALTQRIANAVARRAPKPAGAPAQAPPGDLVAICNDAQLRVVAYTGLQPATLLPVPEAIQRSDWIAANVASIGAVIDPIAERLSTPSSSGGFAERLRGPARATAGALLSAEAGALTGYLSQRVLGQFEFVITDPSAPARLLFVAPNIAQAALRLELDEEQLLTWIAFHEVTHAVQFTSVPWLREHLAALLGELLDSLELKVDPSVLLRPPAAADVREMVAAVRQGGLVAAFGGPQRRELLDRVQAVMGVIEGHAEHVMDIVGADALPTLATLRAALDRRRRERPPLLALLERLIGLEAKMRQYAEGKRFCDAVAAASGPEGLQRVFDAPEQLPTLDELRDPAAWMRRTGVRLLAS